MPAFPSHRRFLKGVGVGSAVLMLTARSQEPHMRRDDWTSTAVRDLLAGRTIGYPPANAAWPGGLLRHGGQHPRRYWKRCRRDSPFLRRRHSCVDPATEASVLQWIRRVPLRA